MVVKIGSVPRETLPNRPPKDIRKQRTKRYKTTGYRSKIPARPPLEKFSCTVHTPARSQHGHPVRLPFFLNRHQIVPHRNARGVFHFMHRKQRGRVTNQSHGRTFGTQYKHTCSQNTLQKKYNFVKIKFQTTNKRSTTSTSSSSTTTKQVQTTNHVPFHPSVNWPTS
jgi:hypothetical protein